MSQPGALLRRRCMSVEKTEAAEPMIEVRELRKVYQGGVEAVKGISFDVNAGEVFGLLGPNGAGKSTTIGMLTTAIAPTGGTATVAGHDVLAAARAARAVAGIVFQDSVIDLSLTGRRNLDIHGCLWGIARGNRWERIDAAVAAFGLQTIIGRAVASYSGGERRRLEIARALISRPQVLFLDEPTVGLDPRIRFELLDLIAGLRTESNLTILLTTHYLDEAERLCDRIAVMHESRIVALDTPAALLAGLGAEVVELRVDHEPAAALAALQAHGLAGDDAIAVGSTITVPLHERPGHEAIAAIATLPIVTAAVAVRRSTLDDVYLRLTGSRIAA